MLGMPVDSCLVTSGRLRKTAALIAVVLVLAVGASSIGPVAAQSQPQSTAEAGAAVKAAAGAAAIPATKLHVAAEVGTDRSHAASSDGVPAPPADATAAKVYAILDQACAGCHQAGRGPAAHAVAEPANILALERIAADPALVRPGLPDASALYNVLLTRHAPLPLSPPAETGVGKRTYSERSWPTSLEIQSVREWIDALPAAADAASCPGRQAVTPDIVASEVTRIVTEAPAARQPMLRFLTLAPLYNACVADADLDAYRQAVVRLLNSLSWAEKPFAVQAAGPGSTLLVVDLGALQWVPAHWQRLASLYPLPPHLDAALDAAVGKLVETSTPVLRADWFAAAAATAPLYYDLIGLPSRMSALEQILSVNGSDLVLRGAAIRAGIEMSAITGGARMIERLPARTGSLWRAYDVAGGAPGDTLARLPVGPAAVPGVEGAFAISGSRVMFTSPSGLMMFGQFDAAGERVGTRDSADGTAARRLAVAGSCLSCHASGPLPVRDEVRALAQLDATPKPVRDAILSLHPEQSAIDGLMAEDRRAVQRALMLAGMESGRMVGGREPLAALIARYEAGGDLDAVAREWGRSRADLVLAMARMPEELRALLLRASVGPVGRADLNRLLMHLAKAHTDEPAPQRPGRAAPAGSATDEAGRSAVSPAYGAAAASSIKPLTLPTPAKPVTLSLWPSQLEFRSGDLAAFFVRSTADCYLTVLGIDRRGIATVLFPSDFEPDNLLAAGRTVKIPSDEAGYRFRLKDPGREQVVALCTTQARTFAGMEHDFERTRFTVLGNWGVFITGQLDFVDQQKPPEATRARAKSKEKADRIDLPTIASQHARTAIAYEIKP